jgi:hypothetical protein
VKIPNLDDNHIPVDAERLMNMAEVDERIMNLNQWMATFQSPMQLAKTAHKQIAAQHYEIQALKAQLDQLRKLHHKDYEGDEIERDCESYDILFPEESDNGTTR